MLFLPHELRNSGSEGCSVMIPDQDRFHTKQTLTEYDAASIGSAAAAEWRFYLHTAVELFRWQHF